MGNKVVQPLDGVMFAGAKETLERLRNLKPAPRPDLDAGVRGRCRECAVQVAIVPAPTSGGCRRPDADVAEGSRRRAGHDL